MKEGELQMPCKILCFQQEPKRNTCHSVRDLIGICEKERNKQQNKNLSPDLMQKLVA